MRLDEAIKDIKKKYGDILTQGMPDFSQVRKIPFTSPRMNYSTFGGVPMYHITEFYGEEHGGKTTSALDIVANYQRMDDAKAVLYVDAENTLDSSWAKTLGVDLDSIHLLQPKEQSAEEIFQMIYDLVCTGEVGLWVLDSIASLETQQAWDKDLTEKTYAGISAPLSTFSKRMIQACHKYGCTGLGINQLRDNLNSMYGGTKTPGGRAWKHFCSARMEFKRGDFLDSQFKKLPRGAENPVGCTIMMTMVKNKFCPPTQRLGYYTLSFTDGINYLYDLVDVAIKYDIVKKSGSWFEIVDSTTGEILADKVHGQSAVYNLLEEDKSVLNKVEQLVENFLQKS